MALACLVNTKGLLDMSTVPHLDGIDADYTDVSCKQFMKKKNGLLLLKVFALV